MAGYSGWKCRLTIAAMLDGNAEHSGWLCWLRWVLILKILPVYAVCVDWLAVLAMLAMVACYLF
jgi:hypothetical protein